MLFYGKMCREMLFVQLVEQTACPLGKTPNLGAQEACPSGNIKNALEFTHRMWGPLTCGSNEIYAGLFNSQHVQTGTSTLEISSLTVCHQFWMSSTPTESKAKEAASSGASLAYRSPMI